MAFYVSDRSEARTGHGLDAVTGMLPVFVGREHTNRCTRYPKTYLACI
jgi:hypothetical protein